MHHKPGNKMPNRPALLRSGVLLFFCHLFGAVAAQQTPGVRDSVYSKVLGEKRFVQVVLPENYRPGSGEKYDVLYLLDGDGMTAEAAPIQHYAEQQGFMPATIIVGIFNVDRNRDFLPTKAEGVPAGGGAGPFLAFLKDELIPYVNQTYPSNGTNTLYGHSFGGVFALYAFAKAPDLFASYIAADPAFWCVNEYLIPLAAKALAGPFPPNKTFFVSGRAGWDYQDMGITPVDSLFRAKAPKSLQYQFVACPNETHMSINFKTVYDGLKFTYAGHNVNDIVFHPMNGTVIKNKPIQIWSFSDPAYVRYTTNGSEPTPGDAQLER